MEWKNKKGKLRGRGNSELNFFIVESEGAWTLKVERMPGKWDIVGKFGEDCQAKQAAEKEDEKILVEKLERAQEKLNKMRENAWKSGVRERIKDEFPPSYVRLFKQYARWNERDRVAADDLMDRKGMGDVKDFVKALVAAGVF